MQRFRNNLVYQPYHRIINLIQLSVALVVVVQLLFVRNYKRILPDKPPNPTVVEIQVDAPFNYDIQQVGKVYSEMLYEFKYKMAAFE